MEKRSGIPVSPGVVFAKAVVLECLKIYSQGVPLGAIPATQSIPTQSGPIGITPL